VTGLYRVVWFQWHAYLLKAKAKAEKENTIRNGVAASNGAWSIRPASARPQSAASCSSSRRSMQQQQQQQQQQLQPQQQQKQAQKSSNFGGGEQVAFFVNCPSSFFLTPSPFMVTRFATSPPTDNCPQPKEALLTVSALTSVYYNTFDSSAL
jgi:transcription initiation factor TFIID subunit TAF12